MQKGVHSKFVDMSTSIREAAVELIGRFVLNKPELILQYYDMIIERILVSCSHHIHAFAGLSLSFNLPVALIFTVIANLLLLIMDEVYQLQASSPVTSRVHQTYSAVNTTY